MAVQYPLKSLAFLWWVLIAVDGRTQPQSDPVAYLDFLTSRDVRLAQEYLTYMVAAGHGGSEPGVEGQRMKVLDAVAQFRSEVERSLPYKSDDSLRTAYLTHLESLHEVFSVDYAGISGGPEVADDPVADMRARLERKDAAAMKVARSSQGKQQAVKAFARRYEISLVLSDKDLSAQVDQVVRVGVYYNRVYLLFYTSVNREMAFVQSLDQQELNHAEQARAELLSVSTDGLSKIDEWGAFDRDGSLVEACRQMLLFHRSEAEARGRPLLDFLRMQEQFAIMKAGFSAKPPADRTKAEVEEYNRAVRDLNSASETANNVVTDLNTDRVRLTGQWNSTVNTFLRSHIR